MSTISAVETHNNGGFAAHIYAENAVDKEARDIWETVVEGEVKLEEVESVNLLFSSMLFRPLII
jgi:hypothetical protein